VQGYTRPFTKMISTIKNDVVNYTEKDLDLFKNIAGQRMKDLGYDI
jgi:hypothetical protein